MESSIILDGKSVRLTEPRCVAEAIRMGQNIILLDSRSFVEYNTSHINRAVNIGGNRAVKKKFFKYEVPVDLLLAKLVNVVDTNELKLTPIIVYDQCVEDLGNLRPDCFLHCVLLQLLRKYSPIFVLRGGFLGFRAVYPDLCWESSEKLAGEDIAEYQASDCGLEQILDQCLSAVGIEVSPSPSPSSSATSAAASSQSSSGSTSLSLKTFSLTESGAGNPGRQQPSIGDIKSSASTPFSPESPRPSPILPHVVLGSQADAVSAATCQQYGITHVINVSVDGAAPSHIPADRFFRIPVHDNYTDIMIPFFKDAFTFIDNAKAVRGKVLIHCSAGISRSPTLAIAYLMYSGRMTMREAYNVIKSGRPGIAPNFNFLGQLLEFEHQMFGEVPIRSSWRDPFSSSTASKPTQATPMEVSPSSVSCPGTSTSAGAESTGPPIRRPVLVPSSSPKHLMTKKRERPTYLSLESALPRPGASRRTSQLSSPFLRPVQGPDPDVSPSEGKRSRVSLLTPFMRGATNLLPSPSTILSRLELSSPSDEYRRVLSSSRTSSTVKSPSTPRQVTEGKEYPQITSALSSFSSTSLDKLQFEPCSAICQPSRSLIGFYGLRRSLTSLGTALVRPTLLAERSLSSQFSAPPTPQPSSFEHISLTPTIGRGIGAIPIWENPPQPSGMVPSSSTSFTREFSPTSQDNGKKPKVEYESFQKNSILFPSGSKDSLIFDLPPTKMEYQLDRGDSLASLCTSVHNTENKSLPVPHSALDWPLLSHPSHRNSSASSIDPCVISSYDPDCRLTSSSSTIPFPLIRSWVSLNSGLTLASIRPCGSLTTVQSPWFREENSRISCRQQQQKRHSFSHDNVHVLTPSAEPDSAHSRSCLDIYSVS